MNCQDTYQIKRKQIQNQIDLLNEELNQLDEEHNNNHNDWSFVGSLSEVHSQLTNLLSFLRPVDESEIF